MYKTSTFLTSLFCKFNIKDKEIRSIIVSLYTPLIDECLNGVEPAQRTIVFRALLPSITDTIDYLKLCKLHDIPEKVKNTIYNTLGSHIDFQLFLVKKAGNFLTDSSFKNIMNQVNIDDIGCEIGDCITLYKQLDPNAEDFTETNRGLLTRLEVLLSDYNSVFNTSLTVDSVLVDNSFITSSSSPPSSSSIDFESVNDELY